jgi:hypothetical protein
MATVHVGANADPHRSSFWLHHLKGGSFQLTPIGIGHESAQSGFESDTCSRNRSPRIQFRGMSLSS